MALYGTKYYGFLLMVLYLQGVSAFGKCCYFTVVKNCVIYVVLQYTVSEVGQLQYSVFNKLGPDSQRFLSKNFYLSTTLSD